MNVTWTAVTKDPVTHKSVIGSIPGYELLSMLEKNYTIKIFEKLYSSLRIKKMSKESSLQFKLDIFKDYSSPKPFPKDMFLNLPQGSPNQAYLMLGTKGTGVVIL